jgi:hypothetical protein
MELIAASGADRWYVYARNGQWCVEWFGSGLRWGHCGMYSSRAAAAAACFAFATP